MRTPGRSIGSWLGWLIGGALGLGAIGPAAAETVNCTAITALPAVITVQGVYCLTGNLTTAMATGNAIEIQANNVVLDLNGHRLAGLAGGPGTQATGIYAFLRQNITIKNGTIRGFFYGIYLNGSARHVVENMYADQNRYYGLWVSGDGSIVRNNQILDTGGSTNTNFTGGYAFGIVSNGDGTRVLNNDVIHTFKHGGGMAHAIRFPQATGALAVNNRITQADIGIVYVGASTGKYRDNLTFDVTTPFTGGTDAGNNN